MLDNPETIDQNAQRWADLMDRVGLRGHVFAEGEAPKAKGREKYPVEGAPKRRVKNVAPL